MRQFLRLSLIFALSALFVVPALAQTEETIALGDTVEGTLTGDALSQTYTLEAEAGQIVTITLTSDAFDTYLTLLDEDGNVLAEDDDTSGTNSALTRFALPSAAGYTLLVESYGQHNDSNPDEGDYTLSVIENQVNRIEYSQTIQDQLTTDTPSKEYVFTGQAGDVIVITESSEDFDSYLHLLDPTGFELVSNDDSDGSLNAMIGPYTLPDTGSYTIRATSLNGTVAGSFTLSLRKTDVTPISYDEPVEVNLTPRDQGMYFTFEGTSGDLVSVTVDSDGSIDTSLVLSDPNNSQLITDTDSGSGFDPEIYQQLISSTGTYTIALQVVTPGTGQVTLTIERTPPPSLDEGVQTITFSDTQNSRAVTFTAEAGESVRLNIHAVNDRVGSPNVSVIQGDSTFVTASGSSVSDLNFSFVVRSDGLVTVRIVDYSYSNVSYEVSLAHATE